MHHTLYEQFQQLTIDPAWIGLAHEDNDPYFCTPIGAKVIGWDNGLHYCFIEGFGEMVFAVNPESSCDVYVYPLAQNFADFLRLLLATKNTNTMQQIILWDEPQYLAFIQSPAEVQYASQKEVTDVLMAIQSLPDITPMEQPFAYIKNLQQDFAYDQIPFRDEFYEITGREKP